MLTVWQQVDEFPQLFAYRIDGQPPAVPNMMVIGGVTVPEGDKWPRSKVDPPGTNPPVITSYAPSFHINVPKPDGGWRNPHEVQGVSYGKHCCPLLRPFLRSEHKVCTKFWNPSRWDNLRTWHIFFRTFQSCRQPCE